MYRFGNMDGIDPRTQREALGDDPVRASGYGVANLQRLMPMLLPATTTDRLDDYDLLNDMYGRVIGQWALEMNHVAVVVGGVYRHEKYPDQPGTIHTAVPRAKQAEAVRFLLDNVFTTPTWMLDTAILRRIEPTGCVERVRIRQTAVLTDLLLRTRGSRGWSSRTPSRRRPTRRTRSPTCSATCTAACSPNSRRRGRPPTRTAATCSGCSSTRWTG